MFFDQLPANSFALVNLLPGFSPTIRKSVFTLIVDVTLAPYFSTIFDASIREISKRLPVKTKVFPYMGLEVITLTFLNLIPALIHLSIIALRLTQS